MSSLAFLQDVDCLFKSTRDDKRIARIMSVPETRELARVTGVRLLKNSGYIKEHEIVGMIRAHRAKKLPPRPCAGCALSGRRWLAANAGRPITYRFHEQSLDDMLPGATFILRDIMSFITKAYGVRFERVAADRVPDFTCDAAPIDSMRGGTLGVMISYESTSDDIDVGQDEFISAHVRFDTFELWDRWFFFTVAAHEFFHLMGLDHAPDDVLRDLMKPFYQGSLAFNEFGMWSHLQMLTRYVGVPS